MDTCDWFAKCTKPMYAEVQHPTIGWVNICREHLEWLGDSWLPSITERFKPSWRTQKKSLDIAAAACHTDP